MNLLIGKITMKNVNKYILTIDQGTTSTRTIIFDSKTSIVAKSQMEFTQICPKNGWVEHNPEEIWELTVQTIKNAMNMANLKAANIMAIGITNQRETTILWNKNTGKVVYNAIVWQSRQSQAICDDLIKKGLNEKFHKKTGLIINPYFSASKIKWIFDNVKNVKEEADKGNILFGTIDTYLLWKLTKGEIHATDYSNASRTLVYNIIELKWDEELLNYFDIPKQILPKVYPSGHIFGFAKALTSIDKHFEKIPIASLIGDQQAALFGQCCFDEGSTKSTYGTGCFILMNTNDKIIYSDKGLLTTIAWGLNGKVKYALEGSVFVSGSAIQWLRDGMELFKESSDCEKSIRGKNPSGGIYFVPAFVGLGTPYWDNDARGAIFGITRATTKDHITVAAIEASPYQARDVMEVMIAESGFPINYLGVDGGASVNNYMMQFQANLLDAKIVRPTCLETTALGAMYLAALTVGFYESEEEIKRFHQVEKIFMRQLDDKKRQELIKGWKIAVDATLEFKNK